MASFTPFIIRSWTVVALLAAIATPAAAQTPYQVTHSTDTYTSFTVGTSHVPVAYGPFTNWDEGAAAISLPFPFDWYGVDHRTVYVYTNGFVSFDPPPTGLGLLTPPRNVPAPANTPHNFIGVLWTDLVAGANPSIRSRVAGTAGSRVFVVQVEGLQASNNVNSGVRFQVIFNEGSNQVDLIYGPNFGLSSVTAGIENDTGSDGQNLMALSPTCGVNCACGPRLCASGNFPPNKRITIRPPDPVELNAEVVGPNGADPGSMFDVDVTIRNVGLTAATGFRTEIRLSPSNTSTAGSTLLGFVDLPGLAPSSTATRTLTLTLAPTTPVGRFYLAVVTDSANAIVEAVETNNISFDGPFVTGPDLQAVLTAPLQTGPLETLPVTFELESAGAPVTDTVRVSFFLGTSTTRSGTDIPLGARSFTLPDGFTRRETVLLTVPVSTPLSPPPYYVLADIDDLGVVTETDENNNLAVSTDSLEVRAADIQVPVFSGDRFGFRGQPYPVEMVVLNDGGAAGRDLSVCVFLSDNPLISVTSDRRLIQTSTLTLPAGEQIRLRLEPVIPADVTLGAWFVAAVADCEDAVIEGDEVNNINRRTDAITVRDVAPDFVPLEVVTASASAAGETLPLSVLIANLGNAAGEAHVRVALSENPGVTTMDPVVFETNAPVSLAPPEETSVVGWGDISPTLPSGSYFVGAIVDPTGAVDEVLEDNNVVVTGPINVAGSGLAIVTPAPPNGIIGVPYARRFDAVGGDGNYTWSLTWNADAPAGLSFDPAVAELGGTPTAAGSFDFELRATSGPVVATRTYRLIVSQATVPLTVVSSQVPPAVARESYSIQLVAVGGQPPYQWRVLTVPPIGLSLSADGLLGGEPQVVGASTFDISVVDSVGGRATGTIALQVLDPTARLAITTADLPDGIAGSDYVAELQAEGGRPPLVWTIDGRVPPGLTADVQQTVLLAGTPTVAGSYPLVFEVRDQDGLVDRNAFVVDIIEAGLLAVVTGQGDDPGLPQGLVGQPYQTADALPVQLRAIPADGLTWSLVTGLLPPGLTLTPSGVIEGTPTAAGAFAFTVVVTNEANDVRRATLALVISDLLPPGSTDDCSCRSTRRSSTGVPMGVWAVLLLIGWRWGRRRGAR